MNSDANVRQLVRVDVKYPEFHEPLTIPDEWVGLAVRELRKNLELAVLLERDTGGSGLHSLPPIEPDPDLAGETTERTFGLSSHKSLRYADLMQRLIDLDIGAARHEYRAWWDDENTVFARLRIWSGGQRQLVSNAEVGRLVMQLEDEVFWNASHQRDLLLMLKKRWNDLSATVIKKLGKRLLRGPPKWNDEEEQHHQARRAHNALTRMSWLRNHGAAFSFDVDVELSRLRAFAPDWRPEFADEAVGSLESRSGSITVDTDFSGLLRAYR